MRKKKKITIRSSLSLISRGFTLIEIAVVLFIISLLLAGLLAPLMTVVEQRDRQQTVDMLADIRENLIGYALIHGRLPCPAQEENGIEDTEEEELADGSKRRKCTNEIGELPWATLGVAAKQDAWGHAFIYRVDDDFADDDKPCGNSKVSFCFPDKGNININKDTEGNKLITDPVPVIIVSVGRHDDDTLANLSAEEQENKDGDTDFMVGDYRQQQDKEFDDILVWITPTTLMYQMVQAGMLP